jgi:acyl-CoA synthetase (NDP forming)
VTIVTSSGGASTLTNDAAVQMGLRIDALSPSAADATRPLLPYYGSVANPVVLTGALLNDPP